MSKSPKRRAHVWYSINNKSELVMQDENEEYEPLSIMNILCAIGFFMAFALVVTGSAYALEGVLCVLGVISDC